MNYSLEEVRNLFEQFNLYTLDDGTYVAMRVGTKIYYSDPVFVEKVKFAHTWFAATKYGRSLPTIDAKQITESDYMYAFNDGAKETYDYIMAVVSPTMQATGHLLREDVLKKEIVEALNYKYAPSIVRGLYSQEHFQKSFENWVRMANNLPILEAASKKR